MRILFLAPYPANESPSQRYRFEHYLGSLAEYGIRYDYRPFLDISAWRIFFKPGNYIGKLSGVIKGFIQRWLLMFTIGKYDFIYIHREVAPIGPPVFEWIIARVYRKRIIYDFDDAIWIPVASEHNSMAKGLKWFSKVGTICRFSYKVSAGNNYLADFARNYNKNTFIIPTVVDTENVHNLKQEHSASKLVVGWTGTLTTLKYLDIVLPALQQLQQEIEFTFVVIANKDPMLPLKNYRFIPWKKETEIQDLLNLHVGLMPLYDNPIERGKCGFKAIQYMSLGIPAVVSSVGVNTEIVMHGENGYVAGTDQEWITYIRKLLMNAELRKEFGIEGRLRIEKNYSVKATLADFIQLFS